ncbi:ABC transporter ATP-binding protein, partial [Oceanobacillus arenosus]
GKQFYIIDDGMTVHSGQMVELKEDKILMKKYLGIS